MAARSAGAPPSVQQVVTEAGNGIFRSQIEKFAPVKIPCQPPQAHICADWHTVSPTRPFQRRIFRNRWIGRRIDALEMEKQSWSHFAGNKVSSRPGEKFRIREQFNAICIGAIFHGRSTRRCLPTCAERFACWYGSGRC